MPVCAMLAAVVIGAFALVLLMSTALLYSSGPSSLPVYKAPEWMQPIPNVYSKNPKWELLQAFGSYYWLLLCYPRTVALGTARRFVEKIVTPDDHWYAEIVLYSILTISGPFLPVACIYYVYHWGKENVEELGGFINFWTLAIHTEQVYIGDAALRHRSGASLDVNKVYSKRFWARYMPTFGEFAHPKILGTIGGNYIAPANAELDEMAMKLPLPENSLVAKESVNAYGMGMTVLLWKPESGKYDVDGILCSKEEAQEMLQSHPVPRVVQDYVHGRKSLGVHSLRLVTWRPKTDEPARFIYGYLDTSSGVSTSQSNAENTIVYYTIDFAHDKVGSPWGGPETTALWDQVKMGDDMPGARAAVELCLKAHDGLPAGFSNLGWDVILTESGEPCVLEGNCVCWGLTVQLAFAPEWSAPVIHKIFDAAVAANPVASKCK